MGDSCRQSVCECDAPGALCQGACVSFSRSPSSCGLCGNTCRADQTCANGSCECRFGLVLCSNTCVAVDVDVNNCGSCGHTCPLGNICLGGACVAQSCIATGLVRCSNACLTTAQLLKSPLHCGQCESPCPTTKVCAGGVCQESFVPPGCTACPCPQCGSNTACCSVSTSTGPQPLCVVGSTCPG